MRLIFELAFLGSDGKIAAKDDAVETRQYAMNTIGIFADELLHCPISSVVGCNRTWKSFQQMGGCRERFSEIDGVGKGTSTDACDLSRHRWFSIGRDLRPDVADTPCGIVH